MPPTNGSPRTVEDYLAAVPEEARAALEQLRRTIRQAVPEATEIISYRIPTFSYRGPLVAFSASKTALGRRKWEASKNHCALHLMNPGLMAAHKDELRPYDTTTATIRFPADKPLPATLVKKLVKARVEENEAGAEPYQAGSRAE